MWTAGWPGTDRSSVGGTGTIARDGLPESETDMAVPTGGRGFGEPAVWVVQIVGPGTAQLWRLNRGLEVLGPRHSSSPRSIAANHPESQDEFPERLGGASRRHRGRPWWRRQLARGAPRGADRVGGHHRRTRTPTNGRLGSARQVPRLKPLVSILRLDPSGLQLRLPSADVPRMSRIDSGDTSSSELAWSVDPLAMDKGGSARGTYRAAV